MTFVGMPGINEKCKYDIIMTLSLLYVVSRASPEVLKYYLCSCLFASQPIWFDIVTCKLDVETCTIILCDSKQKSKLY